MKNLKILLLRVNFMHKCVLDISSLSEYLSHAIIYSKYSNAFVQTTILRTRRTIKRRERENVKIINFNTELGTNEH